MKLKNKVIVLTGASDGLGKEIALRLAKENTALALIARNLERLNVVRDECRKNGASRVKVYALDIKDTNRLEENSKKIIDDFGKVDVLINNAGIWQKPGSLETINAYTTIEDVIRTNLIALIQLTKFLLPNLKKQSESAIINVSSRSGIVAHEGQSVYSASKWGVRGFTEVLKNDLKGSSVRVAGVYQGGVNTKLFEKANDIVDTSSYTEPSDLADVIVYMLTRPPKIWLHEVRVDH